MKSEKMERIKVGQKTVTVYSVCIEHFSTVCNVKKLEYLLNKVSTGKKEKCIGKNRGNSSGLEEESQCNIKP